MKLLLQNPSKAVKVNLYLGLTQIFCGPPMDIYAGSFYVLTVKEKTEVQGSQTSSACRTGER